MDKQVKQQIERPLPQTTTHETHNNRYTYNDLLAYVPDLKRFVKSKIKTDWWQDVVQDTLTYLFIKFKSILIDNIKGLVINTATMFIRKHNERMVKDRLTEELVPEKSYTQKPSVQYHKFEVFGYNTAIISDRLLENLRTVSSNFMEPFNMQLNDMSIKEIATELSIPENTVKTRINRCKKYLREGL